MYAPHPSFTLRRLAYGLSLLVFMSAAGAGLTVRADEAQAESPTQEQRQAVADLRAASANIGIDGDYQVISVSFPSREAVSDETLAQLKAFPQLQVLSLASSTISDAGLEHLKALGNLRFLTISSRDLSAQRLAELRSALPNCRISTGFGGPPSSSRPTFGSARGDAFQIGRYPRSAYSYLRAASIQQDLELSEEQKQRAEEAIRNNPRGNSDDLSDLISPEQMARLNQIQLQYLQSQSGPTTVFRYRDVVDALQLTPAQRDSIQAVGEQNYRSSGFGRSRSSSRLSDDEATKRIAEVLNEEQQAVLGRLVGAPFAGDFNQLEAELRTSAFGGRGGRSTSSANYDVGGIAAGAPAMSLIADEAVLDELKLSEDQLRKIVAAVAQSTTGFGRGSSSTTTQLESILTDDQWARLGELRIQQMYKFYGPAYIFRYREVALPLRLSEEQTAKLQELLDATRAGMSERLSSLLRLQPGSDSTAAHLKQFAAADEQAETKIAEILSEDQQAQLQKILGERFEGELPSPQTRRSPGPSGPPTLGGRGPSSRREFQVGARQIAGPTFAILLFSPVVQKEVNVTPEQVSEGVDRSGRGAPFSRLDIGELLDAEQTARLRQIYFQYLREGSGAVAPFQYAPFVDELNLNDEQRAEIQALAREGASRAVADEKLLEILTDEQQAKYKDLLGKPVEGDLRNVFPDALRNYGDWRREGISGRRSEE